MKKTFKFTHSNIKPARLFDAARRDVKKYLKRERNKPCPEHVDFWDFDCKFGTTVETAEVIHSTQINQHINAAEAQQLDSFYLEILAKPARRSSQSA